MTSRYQAAGDLTVKVLIFLLTLDQHFQSTGRPKGHRRSKSCGDTQGPAGLHCDLSLASGLQRVSGVGRAFPGEVGVQGSYLKSEPLMSRRGGAPLRWRQLEGGVLTMGRGS